MCAPETGKLFRIKYCINGCLKPLAILAIFALLASCADHAVKREPAHAIVLQIAGVEIYNGLPYSIQNVMILVPESGQFMSCGQILPDSACSTSFPLQTYQGNGVQVSWKEKGVEHSTAEFKLELPVTAINGQMAYIKVEVFDAGQAGAKLVLLDPEAP